MQGGAAGEGKKSPQYASQPQFNAVQILIPFYTKQIFKIIDTNTFMEKIDYTNQKHQSNKLLKNLNY